jgi:hypothetical protein
MKITFEKSNRQTDRPEVDVGPFFHSFIIYSIRVGAREEEREEARPYDDDDADDDDMRTSTRTRKQPTPSARCRTVNNGLVVVFLFWFQGCDAKIH